MYLHLDICDPEITKAIEEFQKIGGVRVVENFNGRIVGGEGEDFSPGLMISAVGKMATGIDENRDEWMTPLLKVFISQARMELIFFKKERVAEVEECVRV